MSTTSIYVLRLTDNKFYIGKSSDVERRVQQHIDGEGAGWTRKYPPVELCDLYDEMSHFDEDRITKEYMSKYGIENVRGGSYVTDVLDPFQIELLQKEIWAAKDCCTNCGRRGHIAKNCHARIDVNGDEIILVFQCQKCGREYNEEEKCSKHQEHCGKQCYCCGKYGHIQKDCWYATQ